MQAHSIQSVTWIVVIVSSLWVLSDARAIGIRKGQVRGLGNLSPAGWFLACLLLWMPAFPYYLYKRRQFQRINGQRPAPVASMPAPIPVPMPASAPVRPAPQTQPPRATMTGMQAAVWGVVLLVSGLAFTAWGGWRSYQDVGAWQQARSQFQEMSQLTPEKLAQMKQDAAHSDNFFMQFAGVLMSPEMVDVLKTNAQAEMSAANSRLLTDLPAALLGLMLIFGGNRLLGRTRREV